MSVFTLSLRNVEDLPHERGIKDNHEITRFCGNGFSPVLATEKGTQFAAPEKARWQVRSLRHLPTALMIEESNSTLLKSDWGRAIHELVKAGKLGNA